MTIKCDFCARHLWPSLPSPKSVPYPNPKHRLDAIRMSIYYIQSTKIWDSFELARWMFASKKRRRHSAIFSESASPRPEFQQPHCTSTISSTISISHRYDRVHRQDNTLRRRCTSIGDRQTTFHIRYAKCAYTHPANGGKRNHIFACSTSQAASLTNPSTIPICVPLSLYVWLFF